MAPEPSFSAFSPFRHKLYVAYWLTALAANFGWLIQVVGTSWMMTSIGGSAQMVGLVQTSLALPTMLFSLAAGAMADTFGRRTMVLWSQAYLFCVSMALAVAAWTGWVTPWILLLFTFLIGTGKALNNPAWQTIVSEFMPKSELPQAIALNSMGFNMARSVGPAIGGAIVAAVGAFAAFLINALSNVFMLVVFWRWKSAPRQSDLPPERVVPAMVTGLRYVAMSPHLLRVMLRSTVYSFAGISFMSLMPIIARDILGGGVQTYGILLGAFGVGAICGGVFSARLQRALKLEPRAKLGFIVLAVTGVVVGVSTNLSLTLLAMAVAGASWVMTLSAFNTSVQMASPRWVVSRCLALYQTCSFAGQASGALMWGWVATHFGTAMAMYASAVGLLLGAALGLVLGLREFDSSNLDPHGKWTKPEMQLDLQLRSGPMMTTIEYKIDEADIDAFLEIMAERRRTRRRDGAVDWNLSRDIEHPELWTERYTLPTWGDTLRFHERRTLADAALNERLLGLHRDGSHRFTTRHHLLRQPSAHRPHEPLLHHDHHH